MENYRNKLLTTLLTGALMWAVTMNAQTDYTSRITNPSCTSASTAYWTMFDNFRLHFFGGANASDSVEEMVKGETGHGKVLYDLQGRRVEATPKKGIYIVNGKKVVISK